MYPSSPTAPTPTQSALEAKTLLYWTLQMHWNNRTHILQRTDPFTKMPTVQSAIQDCNAIMSDLDPKRPVSQLAFKLQSAIISKPDPIPVKATKTPKLPLPVANISA